jgi:hypothetical protein
MFQITIGVKRFAIDHTFCRIKICRVNQLKINGLFGFTDPPEKKGPTSGPYFKRIVFN